MNRYYLMFVMATLLFGSNGTIASHIALSSYEIVLTRTVLGAAALLAVFFFRREHAVFRGKERAWAFLVGSGIAMSANWMFLYEAFAQIGVSLAMLSCYCGPVLVIAVSPFVFHERISLVKLMGLFLVIAGMVCVNGADVQSNGLSWGLFCGIMSGVSFALLIIFNKKATDISGLENAICQLVVASICVAVFTAAAHSGPIHVDMPSVVAILVLGVVNTGLGCLLYFTGMQHMPTQSVSICSYLEPLSALVFAAIFLGEVLTEIQIMGAVMILGGVGIAELLQKRTD